MSTPNTWDHDECLVVAVGILLGRAIGVQRDVLWVLQHVCARVVGETGTLGRNLQPKAGGDLCCNMGSPMCKDILGIARVRQGANYVCDDDQHTKHVDEALS